MKNVLTALVIAIMCAGSSAASDNPDLLSLIVSRLSEPAVLRASFVQEKHLALLARPIVSRGRVIISRGDGLIWQIEAPLKMAIAFTDSRIIEIDAAGKRLVDNGDNRVQAEVGRVFRGLLAADKDILNRYFTLQADGDLQHWRIQLKPRSVELEKFIRTLELSGGQYIEAISIAESNSGTTDIRLRDIATDDSLSADEQALLKVP